VNTAHSTGMVAAVRNWSRFGACTIVSLGCRSRGDSIDESFSEEALGERRVDVPTISPTASALRMYFYASAASTARARPPARRPEHPRSPTRTCGAVTTVR
jgi:hypothetical protein